MIACVLITVVVAAIVLALIFILRLVFAVISADTDIRLRAHFHVPGL